jgi:hypothetical protein
MTHFPTSQDSDSEVSTWIKVETSIWNLNNNKIPRCKKDEGKLEVCS